MLGNTEDVLIYKRLWTILLELVVRHIAATKQRHVELFCNWDTVCHVQFIHCVDCEAFGAVQTSGVFTVGDGAVLSVSYGASEGLVLLLVQFALSVQSTY